MFLIVRSESESRTGRLKISADPFLPDSVVVRRVFRPRHANLLQVIVEQIFEHLLAAAGRQRITLVYGARSETQNQAVVLREALQSLPAR